MSRKFNTVQVAAMAIGLGFLFLFLGSIVVRSTGKSGAVASQSGEPGSEGSGSKLHLQEFYRVQVRHGRQVWEVRARDAKYFATGNVTYVTDAEIVVSRPKRPAVNLRANSARLHLDGDSLSHADLEGNVVVTTEESMTIKTELAAYSAEARIITAPGNVSIDGKGFSTTGSGLEMAIDEDTVDLKRNVFSKFEQGASAPREILDRKG